MIDKLALVSLVLFISCFGGSNAQITNPFLCAKCIANCSVFTEHDLVQCVLYVCKCRANVPLLPAATPTTPLNLHTASAQCPLGYAPVPTITPKANFTGPRPNIVIFLMDDQDADISPWLQAMPFSKKFFGQGGTNYKNAYTGTSICCAARCQILTGLYGHNTGVLTNGGRYGGYQSFLKPMADQTNRLKDSAGRCINNEDRTTPLLLKLNGGYDTFIWGKYINQVENDVNHTIDHVPLGWSEFHIGSDHNLYAGYAYTFAEWSQLTGKLGYRFHGILPIDYATDVISAEVQNYVATYRILLNQTKPLYLYLAPTPPHFPIAGAYRHQILGNYQKYWDAKFDDIVPDRVNYNVLADALSKPAWLSQTANLRFSASWFHKVEFGKRMAGLYAMDEMIASVVRTLEITGDINNTYFFLTSDNGYNFGAHGLLHKQVPYTESVKIPLYIRGPKFAAGASVRDPVMIIDIPATILDLAGFTVPSFLDGQSLVPANLNNPGPTNPRQWLFTQYKKNESDAAALLPTGLDELQPIVQLVASEIIPGFMLDVAPWKAISSRRWRFIEWDETIPLFPNGSISQYTQFQEFELYNLQNDPYEMDNLINEPGLQTFIAKLKILLNQLSQCSGTNCVNTAGPSP